MECPESDQMSIGASGDLDLYKDLREIFCGKILQVMYESSYVDVDMSPVSCSLLCVSRWTL